MRIEQFILKMHSKSLMGDLFSKQLRTSWRKEFETNKETFGLSAVRSYASRRGRNYFLPTGANLVFTNSAGGIMYLFSPSQCGRIIHFMRSFLCST